MYWRSLSVLLIVYSSLGAAEGSSANEAVDDCQALPGITPICGLQAPEDLNLSPFGGALIMGEFGGLPAHTQGGIVRFDLAAETMGSLYPRQDGSHKDGIADWGASDCPAAPGAELSPHGMHVSKREDGQWQLLVVNHWGRESVEFFQLGEDDQLTWRGCVVMPDGAYINDVVGLADGGFYVTHMFDKNDPDAVAAAMQGKISGHIFEWHPGQKLKVMANSEMPFPNGIQISPGGKSLWVNIYSLGEVRKIDRATAKVLAMVKIPSPDNSNWSDDGKLLIASHTGEMDYESGECTQVDSGYCPMAFDIVELDPVTLTTKLMFSHQGAPMGAGTSAVKVGRYLYIGSFSGDRLLKVDLSVVDGKEVTP